MEKQLEEKPLRVVSKQRRLAEIAENRRKFKVLKKNINSSFSSDDPESKRDSFIYSAREYEIQLEELEAGKIGYTKSGDSNSAKVLDIPLREIYKKAAIDYHNAGIYSILMSDTKNAWRCFRNSEKNYTQLAELVKSEPIYGLMVQEANVQNRNATLSRHEAARRRATSLWISFGLCDSITSFLNKDIYSKK